MEYIQPIIGFFILLLLGAIFSENVKAIKIRYLVSAVVIQVLLALVLIKVPLVSNFFEYLSYGVMTLKEANDYGTSFVFGYLADNAPNAPFDITNSAGTFIFAFGGLTLIIVMSAISALLWHWRIIPVLVNALSVIFKKPLDVGGPVGLSATANIFLGQVEAPLLVRPYLASMSKNELLILMTVGMSTIAGSVMVIYTTMLSPIYGIGLIGHFLTASLISVPAAIMYANIIIPSETKTDFPADNSTKMYSGTMDALTRGTQAGIEIFLNVAAMLIVVMALVFLVNAILGVLPDVLGQPLTMERMFGWLFAPLAWCMGIPWTESQTAGELLGVKTILNEFVAYLYLADTNTYVLSEKSNLIMLYALCGFANFSSVGIDRKSVV
jgi:CNT family concentrative nucleoside transporter